MFASDRSILRRFERYSLKKHVRKPTDIIVATDGYCFSACSEFADNCITSGSAIVAGFGVTTPGDEKFVAAQCPSLVLNMDEYMTDNGQYGISVTTTLSESYIVSEDMKEKIPLDYSILRIDKHCGYCKNFDPNVTELLKHTTSVFNEFKTKCNPDNKRLLLIDEKCVANDRNALYSGYVCGDNGEWDKKQCKISVCKPGYIVDFDTNKCVPNCCDGRVSKYPSSSAAVLSSDPKSIDSATTLSPLIVAISLTVMLLLLSPLHS